MDEHKSVTVKYTADKMRAVVALSRGGGQITLGMVLRELIHKGVVHGLDTDVINRIVANPVYDMNVEVAKGTSVEPGADGRVVILAGEPDADSKPRREFAVVKTGEPVARRIPPKPGKDGINVLGDAIPAPQVKDAALNGGIGVRVSQTDANLLVASADGAVILASDGVIDVLPHLEIAGDVDASTEDVAFNGNVTVCGAVKSGFSVEADGSIVVKGEIENARIRCGGDLFAHSMIRGGGRAEIVCGGSVYAPCIENVKLSAGDGVTAEGTISNSEIACKGAVRAAHITGGSVSAVCGIYAARIGDADGERTSLDIGGVLGYIREREKLRGSVDTQNLLTEGYVSELCCFVRDKMDELGIIPEELMEQFETLKKTLNDSISVIRGYESDIDNIEAMLKEARDCGIVADEIHPNVTLKLGMSEQTVREVLKSVNLKPMGI